MKKLLALLALVIICVPLLYGQGTITLPGMTEATTVAPNDILWLWLDPAGANASRKIKASNLLRRIHPCEVSFGSPVGGGLTDGDDATAICGNVSGADESITAVACYADAGSPTVTPILTGGSATSIVTGAITCGNGSWAAGTVQSSPAPVLKTFSANGATCSSTPCDLAANITAANTAKYIVLRFTLSGQ
jgi:hypothetical protein